MPVDSAPDLSYIQQTHAHLLNIWKDTHRNWERADSFYHRENDLWDADERAEKKPEYHPARATAVIDHATDNQLAFEPKIRRFPTGSTEKEERDADRVEPFLNAVMLEAQLLEPSMTWKQVGKNLLLYGYAVVEGPILDSTEKPPKPRRKPSEDDDAFEKRMTLWENEKRTWMPFRIRAPHPARVLLDPMRKRPAEGVKDDMRYAIDLHRLTARRVKKDGSPKRKDSFAQLFDFGNEPYREVHTLEYWSCDWHAIVADSKLLFVEPNTWGYLPFKHAFAGFGQYRTNSNGIQTQYLAVGLLDPIMDSLTIQAQALSGVHNKLVEHAFPDQYTKDAESIRNQKAAGARFIETDAPPQYEHPPEINRWMFEAERLIDFDIEFGTFSRNLAGLRQTGTYTVGQTQIQTNMAEKKFIAPMRQMEQMATLVAQDILRLVDVLDEKLTVRGNAIISSDLKHDYSCEVTFETIDPALELQRREVAMREVERRLRSRDRYWEDARVSNASEERMRIFKDEMFEQPAIRQAFIEETARLFGLIPLLEQLEKQRAEGLSLADAAGGVDNPPTPQGELNPTNPLTNQIVRQRQQGQEFTGSEGI